MQRITLQLDRAINAVIDERLAHPTGAADLLNVLLEKLPWTVACIQEAQRYFSSGVDHRAEGHRGRRDRRAPHPRGDTQ